MIEDTKIDDFIRFQIRRNILNCAKQFLFILEDNKEYILRLEKLLSEMGLEGYNKGEGNYTIERKRVLDQSNLIIRELEGMMEKFNLMLK